MGDSGCGAEAGGAEPRRGSAPLDLEADVEAPLRDLAALCDAVHVFAARGDEAGMELEDVLPLAALATTVARAALRRVRDAMAAGEAAKWR